MKRRRIYHKANGPTLEKGLLCRGRKVHLTGLARVCNIPHFRKGQTIIGGGTDMKLASSSLAFLVTVSIVAAAAGACGRSGTAKSDDGGAAASTRAGAGPNEKYPE